MYKITNKDLRNHYLRWYFLSAETSNNYERLQSLGLTNTFVPRLKKLYAGRNDEYCEAVQRYMVFYNSEGSIGTIIQGIALSMEEDKANGDENITGDVITGIKTGLMGPVAGMGDTLIQGTIKPLVLGIASSFAMEGSGLGALIAILEGVLVCLFGYFMFRLGYRLGKDAVAKLMQSGMVTHILTATSILGLFMMGCLDSTYVKLTTPLVFKTSTAKIALQTDIFDKICPGMLPLIVTFLIYGYFTKKNGSYNKLILFIILGSLACSFLGILQ
jgi:D-glucosaminate-specific PTS system IID component